MMLAIILAATLLENCASVSNASVAIDAAIVAKGGTTAGGLTNAAAAIAALPSGGTEVPLDITANGTYTAPSGTAYNPVTVSVTTDAYSGEDSHIYIDLRDEAAPLTITFGIYWCHGSKLNWGDGSDETYLYDSNVTHTYAAHGYYHIVWSGLTSSAENSLWILRGGQYVDRFHVGKYFQRESGRIAGTSIENFSCAIIKPSTLSNYESVKSGLGIFGESCDGKYVSFDFGSSGVRSATARNFMHNKNGGGNHDIVFLEIENAKIIGQAFESFKKLTKISFSGSMTFDWEVFRNCPSTIRTMVFNQSTPPSMGNNFSSWYTPFVNNDYSIRVPSSSITDYVLTYPYSLKADHIVPVGSAWDLGLAGYGGAIAVFDSGDNLIGGAAFNAPTVSSTKTVSWTGLSKYFTSNQRSVIEATMTSKGYTVAW